MAAVPETVLVSAPQDHGAQAASEPQATAADSPPEDFRVRCTSKRAVVEVMKMCGRFVQELGAALPEDIRELALRDLQWVRTDPSFSVLTQHSLALARGPRQASADGTMPQTGLGNAREGH